MVVILAVRCQEHLERGKTKCWNVRELKGLVDMDMDEK